MSKKKNENKKEFYLFINKTIQIQFQVSDSRLVISGLN